MLKKKSKNTIRNIKISKKKILSNNLENISNICKLTIADDKPLTELNCSREINDKFHTDCLNNQDNKKNLLSSLCNSNTNTLPGKFIANISKKNISTKRICRYIEKGIKCPFGVNCRYNHEINNLKINNSSYSNNDSEINNSNDDLETSWNAP